MIHLLTCSFSCVAVHTRVNFPRRGKWSKCGIFIFFWSFAVTKRFDFFKLFLTVLKRFCPLYSKNVFVLALLETELELFQVDDIGDDGNGD